MKPLSKLTLLLAGIALSLNVFVLAPDTVSAQTRPVSAGSPTEDKPSAPEDVSNQADTVQKRGGTLQRHDDDLYRTKLRRRVLQSWKPDFTRATPVVQFQVSSDGAVSDVKILTSSGNEKEDKDALEAVEKLGTVDIPPHDKDEPVVLDFAIEPWSPFTAAPYPESPEELLMTVGFAYELAGLLFSFLVLISAFSLVFIKKFSRTMQMAFVSICLAIASIAAPGVLILLQSKVGTSDAATISLVQVLIAVGVFGFLVLAMMPMIIAVSRGKRGNDLMLVGALNLTPLSWPAAMFFACKGPRASRAVRDT